MWLTERAAITYGEGGARINRLAHALRSLAWEGDRVALLTTNRFEGLEAHLAVNTAGMAAVPMNPKLHHREYEYIIANADAGIVIFSNEFRAQITQIRPSLAGVHHWICIGDTADGFTPYESLLAEGDTTPPEVRTGPDDLAWLFYTSGTTGQPKGAMETHRNLLTMIQQFLIGVVPGAGEDDVMLHAAPICHGSGTCMLPFLAVGAAQAFLPKFDALSFLQCVARYRVTATFLAPTMVDRIVNCDELSSFDTSSLTSLIYGGGPMHGALLKRAMEALGPVFVQIYGQGEAPFTISAMSRQDHVLNSQAALAHRLGSAGRVMTGTRVEILDDDGKAVQRGEKGEICVKGDLVMPGYWRNAQATADTLAGGWLHTGDVGYLDEDDYLYISDRKKDFIISGGSNIYSREVEEVITRHPLVAAAAVIGVPDAEWGESVKAFVVRQPGAVVDGADIIAFCKDNMASYKKPKFVEFIDELPRNATGKVLKRELRLRRESATD